MFFGRAFMHIVDGILGVIIGLTWGWVLLGVDYSHTHFGGLLLTILITTFSTAGLGLLMGCISLITANVMFVNNTVYFLLLLFSGANIPIATLPVWMQAISNILPLTRGIASARALISGQPLSQVSSFLWGELWIGVVYFLAGYLLFRWFETQARMRGTLETV
jgi:ABC-2 type transport system permease protein